MKKQVVTCSDTPLHVVACSMSLVYLKLASWPQCKPTPLHIT